MKTLTSIFFFFLLSGLNGQTDELRIQLDRIIRYDTDISFDKTPGILIGIIDRDTSFVVAFGKAEVGGEVPLRQDDIFELGSISKVFTATLIAQLIDSSLIDPTKSINAYLPADFSNPRMADKTVVDLMMHTSGLPKRPKDFGAQNTLVNDPYQFYTKEHLLEYYREFLPPRKQEYQYSHTGYGLLELIVEQVTSLPFEEALHQYVLRPMDLQHTFIHFPEQKAITTPGYTFSGRKATPWHFSSFAASEGLKSTMDDLIRFVHTTMQMDSPWLHSLAPYLDQNIKSSLGRNTYAGPGWQIVKTRKWYDILMHSGVTSGHHCYLAVAPDTQTGVVILSNSAVGTEDLSFLVLRMINYNWDRKRIDG